jgi:hypothetical protein
MSSQPELGWQWPSIAPRGASIAAKHRAGEVPPAAWSGVVFLIGRRAQARAAVEKPGEPKTFASRQLEEHRPRVRDRRSIQRRVRLRVRNIGLRLISDARNPPIKAVSTWFTHRRIGKRILLGKFLAVLKIFLPIHYILWFHAVLSPHPVVVGCDSLGIRDLLTGCWGAPEDLFTNHSQNTAPQ